MSKKLSQSEIDALVASLLAGEAPAGETPAESAASGPETAPDQPQGATDQVAASDIAALAATLAATPSEPDLAAITAALAATPSEPDLDATSAQPEAPSAEPDLAAGPLPFDAIVDLGLITEAEVTEALHAFAAGITPAAAAVMAPPAGTRHSTPAAQPPVAPTLPVVPPSTASYEASQAQAAAQTRRVLSMAALSGVVMDIELTVAVELGRARLSLGEVLALGPGSVVTLDKLANTPVDVMVNRVPLMKADVLAIGEKYGIRVIRSSLKVPAAS